MIDHEIPGNSDLPERILLSLRREKLTSLEDFVDSLNGDSLPFEDYKQSTPKDDFFNKLDKEELEKALAELHQRERDVIRSRFGFNGEILTLKEIGERMKITRERVRQIQINALGKLKKYFKKLEK
jgi:RNA polymerase sigma factor (sigma-70 family)